jgi:hypothetical protein
VAGSNYVGVFILIKGMSHLGLYCSQVWEQYIVLGLGNSGYSPHCHWVLFSLSQFCDVAQVVIIHETFSRIW